MSLEAKIEALTAAVEALTAALSATDAEVKTRKPRAKPEAADTAKMAEAVVEAPVVEAPVVEAPVVEAPVVEAPVVSTASETLVVDMEVLKAKFRQFMSARGSADARAMLTEFGVPSTGKLVDLPADKYGALHAKLCEELGA